MNNQKILFEYFACNKKFSVEICDYETPQGKKFRYPKEGIIFLHTSYPYPDNHSYYCKDCQQRIKYN